MKKIVLGIAAVLAVVIVAAVAVPFLIPLDTYKNQIREQVRTATGREVTLAGDISLSLLPSVRLSVADVAFANADWAEEPHMAELDRLRVAVDPWALIGGEVKVERFVLDKPVIHLAVNAEGKGNWVFAGAGAGTAPEEEAAAPAEGAGGGLGLADLRLEDVRLIDGRVTYADAATGARYEITGVNLTLALETLDAPFHAEGAVTYNGETIEVDLDTGPPRDLMDGKRTDLALSVDGAPLTLSYDGSLTNAPPRRLDGTLDLRIPSLKDLAAWAGSPIEAAPGTLETFELAGEVTAKGDTYAFAANTLKLDKISGQGKVGVNLAGARPALTGNLDLAALDVTPYMPPPTEGAAPEGESQADDGAEAGAAEAGAAEAGASEWSDDPIDLSGLKAADVDFDIASEGIKAREITVGSSKLSIVLNDGRLQADLAELNLYEGQGEGRVVVDGQGEVPGLQARFDLRDVQAHPLLRDAAGFERLEGTGAIRFDVAGAGRSQKALVNDLDGEGAIQFRDGAILGLNLAQMLRNVGGAFKRTEETQKTDFAELSGTFTIENGLLRNDDLLMLNPLLRVRGAGQADLPARTVNYRVTPKAVATLEGQGGDAERKGIAVPVIVEGPWHDVAFRPDLKGMLEGIATDPAKLKESAQDAAKSLKEGGKGLTDRLKENLGGALQGAGGGADTESTGETGGESGGDAASDSGGAKKAVDDAEKAIKSLFGD